GRLGVEDVRLPEGQRERLHFGRVLVEQKAQIRGRDVGRGEGQEHGNQLTTAAGMRAGGFCNGDGHGRCGRGSMRDVMWVLELLASVGGKEGQGGGKQACWVSALHPHPNPPPSRGREQNKSTAVERLLLRRLAVTLGQAELLAQALHLGQQLVALAQQAL